MDDAHTFTLKFPFTSASGDPLATLPIKRLKRKDISAAQAVTKDEGVMEDQLVAKLLGITLEDLGEFDIADSTLATEVLRKWQPAETLLQSWDEALLLILRLPPSEIERLDMVDYWRWVDVCQREINRRLELAEPSRS